MKFPIAKYILLVMICCSTAFSMAQESATKSIESTVNAFFESVSFPEGKELDLKQFNKLFTPNATVTPLFLIDMGVPADTRVHPLLFMIEFGDRLQQSGKIEKVIVIKSEEFGRIGQAMVSSESKHNSEEGHVITERAVTSFQLVNFGDGWKISSLIREVETDENPIPSDLLN